MCAVDLAMFVKQAWIMPHALPSFPCALQRVCRLHVLCNLSSAWHAAARAIVCILPAAIPLAAGGASCITMVEAEQRQRTQSREGGSGCRPQIADDRVG